MGPLSQDEAFRAQQSAVCALILYRYLRLAKPAPDKDGFRGVGDALGIHRDGDGAAAYQNIALRHIALVGCDHSALPADNGDGVAVQHGTAGLVQIFDRHSHRYLTCLIDEGYA